MAQQPWQKLAENKRKQTFNKIPNEWQIPKHKLPSDDIRNVLAAPRESGILTEREIMITEKGMADTLHNLRTGKWTSREVTEAICKRAAIAHQLTNCLTEIFFDEGFARAQELDDHLRVYGKPFGPVITSFHLSLMAVTWITRLHKGSLQRQRT